MRREPAADTLRILLVDDSDHDRLIFVRAVCEGGLRFRVTEYERAEEALDAVTRKSSEFDVAVVDNALPGMNGIEFCKAVRANGINLPLIILTGAGSEETAVEALRSGVNNYVIKESGPGYMELLPLVVRDVVRNHREYLARVAAEKEKERTIKELQQALHELTQLRGILPICSFCKRIRDDEGYWQQVEVYIRDHSHVEFSHSLCPECLKQHYSDIDNGKDHC